MSNENINEKTKTPPKSNGEFFDELIAKFAEDAVSKREKGMMFEKLVANWLKTTPLYKNIIKDVWLWSDFPYKDQISEKDAGIDLVCKTFEGEFYAVQCKCYNPKGKFTKADVDTFLSLSSKSFVADGSQKNFALRIWIDTTEEGFGEQAQNAIENQNPQVVRYDRNFLKNDNVKWNKLAAGFFGAEAEGGKFDLLEHQQIALEKTLNYLKTNDRGKLIMACGTGKTFTSLKIAQNVAKDGSGLVLFLVPSISLLNQTLNEWLAQTTEKIYPICICSDARASEVAKKSEKDFDEQLNYPASTNVESIKERFFQFKKRQESEGGLIVVFSTYHSIGIISEVQKKIKKASENSQNGCKFDLIICDEAHRTTGVTLADKEESAFVRVHQDEFIDAKKRIYMTATPRLYSPESQQKARENDATLCSMDDPLLYGEEIHRIGFGEAVEKSLLSDYKVIVLTIDENSLDKEVKEFIEKANLAKRENGEKEINSNDALKLVGCINVLSKRTKYLTDKELFSGDSTPMKSAVSFCSSIANSIYNTNNFNICQKACEQLLPDEKAKLTTIKADHVDGKMPTNERQKLLNWLKSAGENECFVLSNVRCLSEGVDVPSLDAIIFLSSKNSQVDVVQSVGRVMRRAKDKKFGYIIIPVVVPESANASEILDKNEDFKIVWSVLNALRAHDDRFNAVINKIELNKNKPTQISVVGTLPQNTGVQVVGKDESVCYENTLLQDELQQKIMDEFALLQAAVYAKMVAKCGDRRYWADWGKDVGVIAQKNVKRINELVAKKGKYKDKFETYLAGLRKSINPSLGSSEAVEMLSQHLITKPVFEAIFGDDHFTRENPVSKSLEEITNLLDSLTPPDELEKLNGFYTSVKKRAEGIDNAEAKQRIVIELYDSFFKHAFPLTVEKLGIVYTPLEVVDFIIYSSQSVLKSEFDRSLSDCDVNIIDPFTGTGTFITRLLQSGIIAPKDLSRKYKNEIFANEIVLLAYYIASINIENAYHKAANLRHYESFGGICFTDTFQMYENERNERAFEETFRDSLFFVENTERLNEQAKKPITVVVGNPPYSVGQRSANDNAQNQKYENLEKSIAESYVALSNSNLSKSAYDSYIKAFRWASDRLDPKDGGVVSFITNSGWVESNGLDGFRKCLEREFSKIYVLNLRGAIRGKNGEAARREGKNIFDIMTGVAITVLVKNPKITDEKAQIYYYDIGDYRLRQEKLNILAKFGDISNVPFERIYPNEHGDWINVRNDKFSSWFQLEPERKFDKNAKSFFTTYSLGCATNRDAWVYNFSRESLTENMKNMIDFYNEQRLLYQTQKEKDIKEVVINDSKRISWTRGIKNLVERDVEINFDKNKLICGVYRPFVKQNYYNSDEVVEMPGLNKKFFPTKEHENLIICVSGVGTIKNFSVLITDKMVSIDYVEKSQCFPLYHYTKDELFEYKREDGISDYILKIAQSKFGSSVSKEDIFYYVYGFLHSKSYREKFANDLKKMLPRLPFVSEYKKFFEFVKAGRKLAHLHLNYESFPKPDGVEVTGEESGDFCVQKMRWGKKGKERDKSVIFFNEHICVKNIPPQAHDYIVGGKSALEWIVDRYAVKQDKASLIVNDPNEWARESGNPRYILDLLLSVINVSVQTAQIVENLPHIEWDNE